MNDITENLPEMTEPLDELKIAQVLEAALMVAGRPMTVEDMLGLFEDFERPPVTLVQKLLERIQAECLTRGVELKETGSGFRFQAKQNLSLYVSRLWDEKPKRYSRSMLETLALIAYRQPITRGEIEEIRGVACNSDIFKTLMERDWIRIVGHRDVPGRPALYATTRIFLDYFNLRSLDQLPSLAELKDLDSLNVEINFEEARRSLQEAAKAEAEIDEGVAAIATDTDATMATQASPDQTITDHAVVDEDADAQSAASGDANTDEALQVQVALPESLDDPEAMSESVSESASSMPVQGSESNSVH